MWQAAPAPSCEPINKNQNKKKTKTKENKNSNNKTNIMNDKY